MILQCSCGHLPNALVEKTVHMCHSPKVAETALPKKGHCLCKGTSFPNMAFGPLVFEGAKVALFQNLVVKPPNRVLLIFFVGQKANLQKRHRRRLRHLRHWLPAIEKKGDGWWQSSWNRERRRWATLPKEFCLAFVGYTFALPGKLKA